MNARSLLGIWIFFSCAASAAAVVVVGALYLLFSFIRSFVRLKFSSLLLLSTQFCCIHSFFDVGVISFFFVRFVSFYSLVVSFAFSFFTTGFMCVCVCFVRSLLYLFFLFHFYFSRTNIQFALVALVVFRFWYAVLPLTLGLSGFAHCVHFDDIFRRKITLFGIYYIAWCPTLNVLQIQNSSSFS